MFRYLAAGFLLLTFTALGFSQQVKPAEFDVTDYKMDIQLNPDDNKLSALVDVTFTPAEKTRSVTFELNGSLKVEEITRLNSTITTAVKPSKNAAPANSITFIQDQVGVSDLGPNVRIDLGEEVAAKTPVTLRFKYSGILNTPQGGPLLAKRLAAITQRDGYLMYAARWFPFHDYAADKATSDITITLPGDFTLTGYSDTPAVKTGNKYRFVRSKPALVGNFAYAKYITRTLRFGDYELQFYTKVGDDQLTSNYGEIIGNALKYYTKEFGAPDMGKTLRIVQIDDESLEFYSQDGMIFMADRLFERSRPVTAERLQREVALQWWGLTVGLKSFDDAWLSQGLAEYSAFSLRESQLKGAELDGLRRELLEKALTFEQTASLARTPSVLDDQSTAYNYIMYSKGAFAFKLLRDTIGEQKFSQLLRTFLQQYRGKNASIYDFEQLASNVGGTELRYFFARWVEGTGVPEFTADYLIIRTRDGKFITRGTVKQNYDNLRLPLELLLRSEGESEIKTTKIFVEDSSADFNIESDGKPLDLVIDPDHKLLRISDNLRVTSIARRGIEEFKEGNYVQAQQQFEAALKLDRSNSWVYYNLGLLFLEQRNYDLAIDNFKATLAGRLNPIWLPVWANIKMGNAYDAKGDRTRAVAAYERAQALGDNYDNAQDAVKQYLAQPYDPRKQSTTAVK